jgi:hypothetical protein
LLQWVVVGVYTALLKHCPSVNKQAVVQWFVTWPSTFLVYNSEVGACCLSFSLFALSDFKSCHLQLFYNYSAWNCSFGRLAGSVWQYVHMMCSVEMVIISCFALGPILNLVGSWGRLIWRLWHSLKMRFNFSLFSY